MKHVKIKLLELKNALSEINSGMDFNTHDFIPKFNTVFDSDINLNQLEWNHGSPIRL